MRVATFFPLREGEGLATFLPPGCHLHAPSWQPRHAAALATEVEIHHLPIDPVRWPAGALSGAVSGSAGAVMPPGWWPTPPMPTAG